MEKTFTQGFGAKAHYNEPIVGSKFTRQNTGTVAPLGFLMNTMQNVDEIMNRGLPLKDGKLLNFSPSKGSKPQLPKVLLLSPKSQLIMKTKQQLNEANKDIKKSEGKQPYNTQTSIIRKARLFNNEEFARGLEEIEAQAQVIAAQEEEDTRLRRIPLQRRKPGGILDEGKLFLSTGVDFESIENKYKVSLVCMI